MVFPKLPLVVVQFALFIIYNANNVFAARDMPDELRELADELHSKCFAETGVPISVVLEARKGIFANDMTLKCYMKCILMSVKGLDDEGNLYPDVLLDVTPDVHKEDIRPMLYACTHPDGNDLCEKAFNAMNCYHDHSPDYFSLP